MKPSLLIMAAGMGSRYGGLKQIVPVGPHGELIIDYAVFDALRGGFGKLVFVIREDIEEEFRRAIGSRFEDQVDVAYTCQEMDQIPEGVSIPPDRTKPWGTGHAILAAESAIHEPFAAINADDFYGAASYALLGEFLSGQSNDDTSYAIVGFKLRHTLSKHGHVARGICSVDEDNRVHDVRELTHITSHENGAVHRNADGSEIFLTGDELVSMNMWGFTPRVLDQMKTCFRSFLETLPEHPDGEFFIPNVVGDLVKKNEATCRILPSSEHWFGVTYREDKPLVEQRIAGLTDQGLYPTPLWD